MTCKRVEYFTTADSDPARAIIGPAGFTAGASTGLTSADNQNLGIDLTSLSRTVIVGDVTAQNFTTISLLQVQVPNGECALIKGIWQYLTIGQSTDNADGGSAVEELPVKTPTWQFQDGWVKWHLSVATGRPQLEGIPNAHSLDGFAGLGTWYDMRFEWGSAPNAMTIGPMVGGPSVIVMWAEVLQTDPTTRQKLIPAPSGVEYAAAKETNFILSFTNAIYWRIAGGLVVEFDRAG